MNSTTTGHHPFCPELCAKVDIGGGVIAAADDTFLVYSVTPSPGIKSICPTSRSQLQSAAAAVAETLDIWHDVEQMRTITLRPLLLMPRGADDESEDGRTQRRLPWFFINAASRERFAVVGKHGPVETLMAVLRRPWCVLELCQTELETLRGLRCFAQLVSEALDVDNAYQGAVRLLAHEIWIRECRLGLRWAEEPVLQMQKVSEALEAASQVSYNGAWLRAIYTCAFRLNIAFSELGGMMRQNAGYLSSFEDDCLPEAFVEYIGKIEQEKEPKETQSANLYTRS
ncbi:MAG: hypothetical protein M1816_007398 [Peltula sp. TS41687]|nr:MAG: hypothetical protein M1816_007398 [Peltula sp. TS41687]